MKAPVTAGVLTALAAGGVMVGLTASAGRLTVSLPAIAAFTIPLLAAGVLFGILVGAERLRLGFGPGIIFWCVGFAAARVFQEVVLDHVEDFGAFLAYQLLVGGAFGLGYVLLYRQVLAGLQRIGARREEPTAEVDPR